jgi:hypothetical protein
VRYKKRWFYQTIRSSFDANKNLLRGDMEMEVTLSKGLAKAKKKTAKNGGGFCW